MKTWSKIIPVFLGIWGWVLTTAGQSPAAPTADAGAIQAIQQATDPSAAVTAFANGFATDRNNPELYEAYITRMVDLGLPELAYHQAAALTTLDANNGLAWGVVGYVDARRGDMPAAISAIVLAGQAVPTNEFVQRTAGEILAWYDLKADKSQIADSAKIGLDGLRARFNTSAAFAQAYDTAKKAYATQTNAEQTPATQQAVPSQPAQPQPYSAATPVYGEPVYAEPAPVYYSNYYYDWGPGWVAPAPNWWWYPCGFFGGFTFFPFSSVVVFDSHHHNDFDHHHHDRDSIHIHDGQAFHHDFNNKAVWHNGANGRANFFGTPAQPNVARVSRSTTVTGTTTANAAFVSPTVRPHSMSTVRAAPAPSAPAAPRATPAMPIQPRTAPAPTRTAPAPVTTPAPVRTAPAPTTPAPTTPAPTKAAPTIVRPAPSGGMAGANRQAFAPMGHPAMGRPSGGGGTMHGNQNSSGPQGGGHR